MLLILFPSLFLFNTFLLGASLCARLFDDKSMREITKQPRARVMPQGPQHPVVQDEGSVREYSLSCIVKPPSDFPFLLSVITELIVQCQGSVYMEVMLQFYTSPVHLPTPSVPANGLRHDTSSLVCLISPNCPPWLFLLFESLSTGNRKSFSVSVLTTACVETL